MARVAGRTVRRAALIRRTPRLVGVDALARDAGVHPEILRRFVRLGLLDPRGGTPSAPLFSPRDALLVARAMRLRRDLGVNYAGAVLASELLARIDQLEQRLRTGAATETEQEVIAWTRTV
jgi:DNA-binding transcriptional MerR regulator